MELVVGKIGRAHGLSGEVGVEVRTDRPDLRFAPGAVLTARPVARGPLTVAAIRWHSGRLLVRFDGCADRTAAESLRGIELIVQVAEAGAADTTGAADDAPADDDDAFYDHQLVGLRAVDADGVELGSIREVQHLPAHDLLVLTRRGAADALVPFVAEIVPDVDLAAGTVTVLDPGGLLDLADPDDADGDSHPADSELDGS